MKINRKISKTMKKKRVKKKETKGKLKPDRASKISKSSTQRIVLLQILMIFSETVRVVIPSVLSRISSNVVVLQ